MKKTIALALFVFAAPVLALSVALLCEHKLDVELRQAVTAQSADLTAAQIQKITVRRLLAISDDADLDPVRAQIGHFNLMRAGALTLIGVVLLYFASLWTAGKLAVRDRSLLLRVFKPGFYLSSGLLAATTVVNAALLMAAIYYGESYLLGVIHPKIILLVGLGAIGGSFAIIKAALASRKIEAAEVFGKTLREAEHPRIWSEVRALAGKTGSLAPENIVMGLDPTFFVTEGDVATLDGALTGRTLFFSAPLTRLLSETQFRAVVAHELGHFKGKDTEYSMKFYPVYRGLGLSLARLQYTQGTMAFAVIPTMIMIGIFLDSFAKAEAKLSRERELAADAVAVSATDARSFAVALARIVVCGPYWEKADEEFVQEIRGGQTPPNVCSFIAARALAGVSPEAMAEVGQGHMSHPTDSHPPTGVRLEAIGIGLDQIRDEVVKQDAGPSAMDIIDGAAALEESLSTVYGERLSRRFDLSEPAPASTEP